MLYVLPSPAQSDRICARLVDHSLMFGTRFNDAATLNMDAALVRFT